MSHVAIELNRIHHNGHADYEDGIVMNASGTGTISDVTVQHNVIDSNYYSGLRVVGDAFNSILVTKNTFFHDDSVSAASGRSEANLDDIGSGANTTFTKNIFVASHAVLNDCYDATSRNYRLQDNLIQGAVPSGTAGQCVTASIVSDPLFESPQTFDFHAGALGAPPRGQLDHAERKAVLAHPQQRVMVTALGLAAHTPRRAPPRPVSPHPPMVRPS